MAFLTFNGSMVQMPGGGGSAMAIVFPDPEPPSSFTGLCFTAQEANSTVELLQAYWPSISDTAYSRDGETWTTFTPSTSAGGANKIILSNIGDKVYFKNTITNNFTGSKCLQFKMSGKIAASGNINSIYNANNFENLTTLTYEYCFANLFSLCQSILVTAPILPATTLSEGCYYNMFSNCSALVSAPVLPATNLARDCYEHMFNGCSSLSYIEVAFSSWGAFFDYTNAWAYYISESGNFVCPSELPHYRGEVAIPRGWTINGSCSEDCDEDGCEDDCDCDYSCGDEDCTCDYYCGNADCDCDDECEDADGCSCDDGCDDEDCYCDEGCGVEDCNCDDCEDADCYCDEGCGVEDCDCDYPCGEEDCECDILCDEDCSCDGYEDCGEDE